MTEPFTLAQRKALAALLDVWSQRQVVLIGAGALACHLPMTWRVTHDLDLTVIAEIDSAASDLRAQGFKQDPRLEHRWYSADNARLDILPITPANIARATLVWPKSDHVMNISGFDLALSNTHSFPIDTHRTVDVATVPVIALLKMAAWLDRPQDRMRDVQDVGVILSEYLTDEDDRHFDDARLSDVEFDDHSALALGLDLHAIIRAPHLPVLKEFLDSFENEDTHHFDVLATSGRTSGRDRRVAMQRRLALLRSGLQLTAA